MAESNEISDLARGMGAELPKDSSLESENKTPEVVEKTPEEKVVEKKVETEVEKPATEVVTEKTTESTEAKETTPEKKETEVKAEVETDTKERKSFKATTIIENISNEFKEEYGVDLRAVQEVASMNYDDETLNPLDIIEDALIARDPDITDREIARELKKYALLDKSQEEIDEMVADGKLTKDDFDDLHVELESRARKDKAFLKDTQAKAVKMLEDFEVEQEFEENNTQNEAMEKLIATSESYLPKFDNVSIDILGEDGKKIDTINWATDDASKKLVSEVLADPAGVWKMWMDDEGMVDVSKMVQEIYSLRNSEKINKAIYEQGLAKGKTDIIKEQDNIDFKPNQQSTATTQDIDPNFMKLLDNALG